MTKCDQTTIYYLEMIDPKQLRAVPFPAGFDVKMVAPPAVEVNQRFYRSVGGRWQWLDRLKWSHDQWHRYVDRPNLETWVGWYNDSQIGYFELETQEQGNIQIVYFGLLPEFIGQGLGGALLSAAVQEAWNMPTTRRVWLHTCSNDHEFALANYRGRGFEVFKTEVP